MGAVGGDGTTEAVRVAPELNLSALEYYLFTFARVRGTAGVDAVQQQQQQQQYHPAFAG